MRKKSVGSIVLIISTWLSSLMLMSAVFQTVPELLEGIRLQYKAGNAKELSKYFNETIELQLLDQDRKAYNKTQAEFIVKDFFTKYPPTEFKYSYKNLEKEEFKLAIADYLYAGGTMRVTMVIKPSKGSYFIDSIVIERK